MKMIGIISLKEYNFLTFKLKLPHPFEEKVLTTPGKEFNLQKLVLSVRF
jgi:hypothetical protein